MDSGFEDVADFRVVMEQLEIAEPKVRAQAHLWRWQDIRRKLLAHEKLDIAEVHRRAFALCNPGLGGRPLAASTLFAAVSVYFPGDGAPVHRHTGSASRFSIEGRGGMTNVAGEKLVMERGDLVITPNGEWHDHGNEGTEPVFWIDVLDVPIVEHFNAVMTEWNYQENGVEVKAQSVRREAGYSQRIFSGASVVPMFGWEDRRNRRFTPKYKYPASEVRAVQDSLAGEQGSPYDGILVEYVDPTSGRSVLPTLSFRSQMLRPGERCWAQRRSASTIFCAFEGAGATIIEGKRFEWSQNDIFVIPGWMWYQHENGPGTSILYSVTDQPAVEKLGFYRAQGRDGAGKLVDVARWPDFD